MIKEFDVDLQVALRALEDVVAPALAGAEKHVVEQFMLAMATIAFVKKRLPEARRFGRMELRGWLDLAAYAVAIAETGDFLTAAIEAGERILLDPAADTADFLTASRHLRDVITALSDASAGMPWHARLDAAILERCGALIDQQIRASRDFGANGWMLWNARNRYDMLDEGGSPLAAAGCLTSTDGKTG